MQEEQVVRRHFLATVAFRPPNGNGNPWVNTKKLVPQNAILLRRLGLHGLWEAKRDPQIERDV